MAYRIEGRDIVIDGWEKGIAPSPYDGIADIRNVNVISIPHEASVGFASTSTTFATVTGSVTSADAGTDIITATPSTTMQNGMAVVFTGGSLPTGITAATTYWVFSVTGGGSTFQIATAPGSSTPVNITATGTGTFATVDMGRPLHGADDKNGRNYLIDHNGRVWYYDGSYFVFTGNTTLTNANGNGLVYYQASDGTGYLFAFRNAAIDYMPIASLGTWTYGWVTITHTASGTNNIHHAIVGLDNVVYYTNGAFVSSFYELDGQVFAPGNGATWDENQDALALPNTEISTWLSQLGTNLMVGGQRNFIYAWDRLSTSFSWSQSPVLLPESNVKRMLTVNNVMYIFMGVRGRIYVTNGTNADLYLKMPDHLSGTVEPYYTWGAVGTNKNQVYFGVSVTTNGGTAITSYGGLWAIDTDTKALRLVNKLSYGTYAGYATAYIPITSSGGAGSGFIVGWDSGASTYGADIGSAAPYTAYESYIDTDIIPVGQYLEKKTFEWVTFLLSKPLVSGEGIKISYRTNLTDSFTQIQEWTTVGTLSDSENINFENVIWVQFRIEMKSTASTPTYTRLREIRIR